MLLSRAQVSHRQGAGIHVAFTSAALPVVPVCGRRATAGAVAVAPRRHTRSVVRRSAGPGSNGEKQPESPEQPLEPPASDTDGQPPQQQEQQSRQQQDWTTEEMLTRMTPMKRGDAADVTLILIATVALVALSMQLYRAWLLYSMFAEESAFQAAGM